MIPVLKPRHIFLPVFCAVFALSMPALARDASFLPPPALSLEEKVDKEPMDLTKPPAFNFVTKGQKKDVKAKKTEEKTAKVKKEPAPKKEVKAPVKVEPKPKPAPTPVVLEEPSKVVEPDAIEMPAKPLSLGAPVAKALLPDVDPETLGTLSPEQGGLGASLWKDASRALVDRLMPAINLPTPSYTLNDLARRMFLTTAAAPMPAASGQAPVRTLMAQRLEGLMNLGAVREAWHLFTLADPTLIDPVTLTRLVEASLIGPESKKICDAVSGLMAAQAGQKSMRLDWQKTLLICQLRDGDKKAVQLSLDMMKEQKVNRDVFVQLLERNVLGKKKRLPRHLTPLRPAVLALLRETGRSLPSYLYKKPAAFLVPELVQAKAQKQKDRIKLAERSAASGILSKAQLIDVYQDVVSGRKSKKAGKATPPSIYRAMLFHAAKHEESPQKKINLIQKYLDDLPKSYQVSIPGQIAADVLLQVPVTSDQNSNAVFMARLFAMTGHMNKAMEWLNLARGVASRLGAIDKEINQNWPVFVLAGMVADGDYALGMKKWLAFTIDNKSKKRHAQRDYAGRVLLLLSASGYVVSETAWQSVIELSPPEKQKAPSPVLLERMHQVAKAGRKGEAILLGLLLQSSGGQSSLSVMVDTVRALRLAGLNSEMQSLAREILAGLTLAE